jgi:Gpi18-like mannosyltransferase
LDVKGKNKKVTDKIKNTKFPNALLIALLIMIVTKVAIFIVSYASAYNAAVSQSASTEPAQIFFNLFNHPGQDGPHYMYLAQHGYSNQGDPANFIVFFPLYPLLVRLITFDFAYVNLSGIIVSLIASVTAVVYLFKITLLDFSDGVAKKAVLFLCIFPTAYFLIAPFTEALFLALAISSLYYARKNSWAFAGILAFLASLTRIAGLLLLPVLAVEYLHQKQWKLKEIKLKFFWVTLPIFGFLIYLLINFQVTGNFFAFLDVERVHWYQTLNPFEGLGRALMALDGNYPSNIINGYAQILFAVFGLMMIFVCFKLKLRLSYQVYLVLNWMLTVSTSFWISIPRYMIIMFPMFIALGMLSSKKPLGKLLLVSVAAVFLVALFFFTYLFATGAFAF